MFEDFYTNHNPRALEDALMLVGGAPMLKMVLASYKAIDAAEFRGALAGAALGVDVGRTEAEAAEGERTSEATDEAHAQGFAAGYQMAEKMRKMDDMNGVSEDFRAYGKTFVYPLQAEQPHMHFEQDDAFGHVTPETQDYIPRYNGFRFER